MSSRVRIGVNLMWLVPGVVGGTEEHTTRLLLGIAAAQPEDIEVVLFVSRAFVGAYPELVSAFPTIEAPLDGRNKVFRVAQEATWLAARARGAGVDLVHHAGGTIPPLRLSPSITSIYDLQPLLLPGNFHPAKQAYLRWRLPRSARHSRLVIALTEHARQSMIERLRIEPSRIVVVPPGFAAELNQEPELDPAARYELDGPFFLFPAITYPHKNHLTLVRAFAPVVAKHPEALLVLTSGAAQMEQSVLDEISRLGIAANVRRVGRVPRGDVDWMLRHAVALTFPSRFEGFGLPVLEAMGNGCPVIAANASALPEVAGNAAILVDPDDGDGWTAAMIELLSNDTRRQQLIEAGRGRARRYTWEASTRALLGAYRQAAGRAEVVGQ